MEALCFEEFDMTTKKLTLTRGDSRTYTLTFKDADQVAYNITGWVIYFTLKTNENVADASASLRKIVTSHTSPTTGVTAVALIPTDTDSLTAREYYYDIQVKTNDNKIYTVMKGKFILEGDVTRGTAST
jgi:hypothetical protein